jgi:hypothetical protein
VSFRAPVRTVGRSSPGRDPSPVRPRPGEDLRPRVTGALCCCLVAFRNAERCFRPTRRGPAKLAHVGHMLVGLSAAWLVVGAAPAVAQQATTLELIWTAPPDCPMREQVLAKSRELLQDQGVRSVSAAGTVQSHPSGFELVLRAEVEGTELSRRLVAAHCDELGDAAALILAMAARPQEGSDGTAAEQTPGSPAALEPTTARPKSTTPTRKAAPARQGAASRTAGPPPPPTHQSIGMTGSVDIGTLPSATPVLGGSVGVWRGSFGAEGQVRHGFKRQQETNLPGKGAALWLTAGTFQGCLAGPVGTAACGGLEVGSLTGRGYGVDNRPRRSKIWAAGVLSGRLKWDAAPWFWLTVSVEGAAPIKRYDFVLERVGSVYGPADVCLRAGLQAAVVFDSR